jgi:hypothetical protein
VLEGTLGRQGKVAISRSPAKLGFVAAVTDAANEATVLRPRLAGRESCGAE